MKEQILKICSFFLITIVFLSCDSDSSPKQRVWRFALEEIEGSVQHTYALKFQELIEKKMDGKVRVKIYPYGTLGTSDQVTEQMATGALQFAMSSPGYLGKAIPEVQVLLLHYVLSEDNAVNKKVLLKGKMVDILDELYRQKGLKLLSFYPEGEMIWTTNTKVEKPEDFSGVKMRVMTSPILLASYKAYGASPVAMPYGEVYSGLQLKMIDGQVNPIFAIEEMSFYEVTDYLIFSGCAQFITSAVAGLPFWESLSPKEKKIVSETIVELQDYIFEVQDDFNQKRLDMIKEKKPEIKIVRLSDSQKELFRERAKSIEKLYLEMGGEKAQEVLDSIKYDMSQSEKEL